MPKEKVVHRKKEGPRELIVTKEVPDNKGVVIDAPDIMVKDPTPIPEEEKSKEEPKAKEAGIDFIPTPINVSDDLALKELETIAMWSCPLCPFEVTQLDVLNQHIVSKHKVDPSVLLISKVTTTFYRIVKK